MIRLHLTLAELTDLFEYQERRRRLDYNRMTTGEAMKLPTRRLAELRARTLFQDATNVALGHGKLDEPEPDAADLQRAARREISALRRQFPEACEEVARDSERELEAELARLLTDAGFVVERQVRTEKGIADLVVGDFVIEVKTRVQTWGDLHRAAGQATAYANALGKRRAIVAAAALGPKVKTATTDVPCVPLGKVVELLKAA